MNKKALTTQRIIVYLILIITAILIIGVFFAPSGFLNRVAEKSKIFQAFLPEQPEGKFQPTTEYPKKVETAFFDFIVLLKSNKKMDFKRECYIEHGGFDYLEDYFLVILKSSSDTLIELRNKEGKAIEREKIKGLTPCVVAGKNKAAKNFYDYWIGSNGGYGPRFSDASTLTISWDGHPEINANLPDFTLDSEMKDNNLLYYAEEGRICFFPTYDYSTLNSWNSGLDAGHIPKIKNSLTRCPFPKYQKTDS
ncbi:hypothetical protein GF336_07035 [Candidatus Woesearchaeota archaeon]|nr:hypothetical protein [Candidatus Woesearchaeota archaeon]